MGEHGLWARGKGTGAWSWYSRGLFGCESMGIMSLARVALRAASERSNVDMLLPTSSVSGPREKQHNGLAENAVNGCFSSPCI